MHTRAKLILVSFVAAVALAALVGTASAQRFETSSTTVRATFPRLRFSTEVGVGGPEATCPVTLEGSFHSRTIVKTGESLVGYLTRAIINEPRCTLNGGVEAVSIQQASLPWHIRYESFVGSLPNITRVNLRVSSMGLTIRVSGVNCLIKSTVARPVRGSATRNTTTNQITSISVNTEAPIPRFEGSFLCPTEGIFQGEAAIRVLGSSTTLIFLRLV